MSMLSICFGEISINVMLRLSYTIILVVAVPYVFVNVCLILSHGGGGHVTCGDGM